ncbi:hypothetical protein [Streptomyces sp. ERV7]|uniref:hypothetical protein n=1 Tax=Streptomyces sp. ERV7 TaxID=1322334 RepID=UPI00131DB7A7|nr:hypothetical protein [Streptomyces sp. ERV7]
MQTEPLKNVGTEANNDRAVPVPVRAHTAHQVDPDLILGERVPVDTSVPQSNRRQPTRPRTAGNVLVGEESHPFESLIFHADIMPQRADLHVA